MGRGSEEGAQKGVNNGIMQLKVLTERRYKHKYEDSVRR
jgi:hypothetical protein